MYKETFESWKQRSNQRQKLQGTYLMVVVVGIVVAGLISLIDSEAGQAILRIVYAAAGLFIINLVVWALISMALGPDEASERPAQTRTATNKRPARK